jgi:O-6-methylguanine DNA methyltransferase
MVLQTPVGSFTAFFSESGLARLEFPGSKTRGINPVGGGDARSPAPQHWVQLTRQALDDVLAGRRPKMLPPLDWAGRTAFQREVWQSLMRIGPGETKTYAQVAAEIGKPLATRATGGACGANPIPMLVPCHRVVAAHGGLGGFSAGLDWKRRLLAREGISIQ